VTAFTLTQLVRDTLVYATLDSIAANVPPMALGALARAGQRERVLAYATLLPDRERQVDPLPTAWRSGSSGRWVPSGS
jgi:hypothetical protein